MMIGGGGWGDRLNDVATTARRKAGRYEGEEHSKIATVN